jgi:replicative DNA helicase
MLESLETYRKIRALYKMSDIILQEIEGDSVDVDLLLDKATDFIAKARKDIDEEDHFVTIGKNSNADDIVHRVLNRVHTELIKTGFTKYDTVNGGLPTEGVMILASTTSGGKSTLLMNMLRNIYEYEHKKVCRISLEMGDEQEMARLLACISEVPFRKIKQNKLSPKEKQRIEKAYREFDAIGKEHDCVFNTVSPTRSMTIDDALRMVKPFRFDVVAIDYVSLLADGSSDSKDKEQWKALNKILADCKVFSRENRCLVVVLCQLNDESDRLRYSQGMKDHADVMWSWNYSKKEQRELRVLPIVTNKARDAELLNFDLSERFDIMSIFDQEDDGYESKDHDADEDANVKDSDDKDKDDDYALS